MNEGYINLKIKEKKIPLKIDAGAQCHVIPESICKDMGIECGSKRGSFRLWIETMGETDMADEYKCRDHVIDFKVGDACVIPVLRLQTAIKLQLIKKFICCRGQL